MGYVLFSGTITGRRHNNANRQDALCCNVLPQGAYGIITDGCSSGKHSEVGAQESVLFLSQAIEAGLQSEDFQPHSFFKELWVGWMRFMQLKLAAQFLSPEEITALIQGQLALGKHPLRDQMARYVRDYWLTTVLGFIEYQGVVYEFRRGDGAIRVNNVSRYISSVENKPRYGAYFIIPWNVPAQAISDPGFSVEEVGANSLDLYIIGSDSWLSHRDLFANIHEFIQVDDPRRLHRQLIIWHEDSDFPDDSTANDAFDDDTSIIAMKWVEASTEE